MSSLLLMINTPLDVERFQLAVVLSKALLLHKLLNIWVGLPAGRKENISTVVLFTMLRKHCVHSLTSR